MFIEQKLYENSQVASSEKVSGHRTDTEHKDKQRIKNIFIVSLIK